MSNNGKRNVTQTIFMHRDTGTISGGSGIVWILHTPISFRSYKLKAALIVG